MTSQQFPEHSSSDLELVQDGIKLTSLVFGINLYTSRSFYDFAADMLAGYDMFLAWCPPERLTFYATETMKVHKPVTKRVLGMLRTWLAPDAPRKHYLALELKASEKYQDTPAAKYEIWNVDASDQANILSMALPATWAQEKPDDMLAFVQKLGDLFPFRCGLVGFAFECSRYDKRASETHAWSMSMRHPGTNIVRIPYDAKAVGSDGLQGVSWLTLIDPELLKQLGGTKTLRSRLPAEVDLIDCRYGTIVKAGAAPSAGDVNRGDALPLYREVYRLVAPWIDTAAKRSMAFRLGKDAIERTEAWYRRLGT